MFKLTSAVEGMEPSIMPMREMHQLIAIGAGRTIEFDDANKTIKMGFNVVEPVAIQKFKKGVLIGFSQGGDYVGELLPDPVHKGCRRYIADPAEVSAVDSPCLPSALVETMKGRTVELRKSNGTTEAVPLQMPDPSTQRLNKIEGAVNQLSLLFKREFSNEERQRLVTTGAAMADGSFPIESEEDLSTAVKAQGQAKDKTAAKKHIVSRAKALGLMRLVPADWTSEADKAAITRACAKIALKKGLYEVGWLAEIVEGLNWLCLNTEFERDFEDDGSKVPDKLREAWLELLAQLKAMVIEEADEAAAAGGKGAKAMKITDQAGLTRAAKSISDHLDKHMEMHKAHHEKLESTLSKDHPLVKSSQAMMDHCEKCQKAAKEAGAGEEPEGDAAEKAAKAAADVAAKAAADAAVLAADPITKAVTAALAPVLAKVDALEKKIATTPAPVAIPHTGAGEMGKGLTVDQTFGELIAK
jgi:hypothetical protein